MSDQATIVEALERATVAVVAPEACEELSGWLLPFDAGPVNRAKSAVPLRHEAIDLEVVPEIIARYRARGLDPQFRLADLQPMAAGQRRIAELGLAPAQPTQLQLSAAEEIVRRVPECDAEVAQAADEAWANVFLAVATPARPAASTQPRLALLRRAPNTLYASVRDHGETLAVGAVSFAFGLACVHGMRTLAERRGRGLARHVLGALARAALARGSSQVFLQVEADNPAALALYQRAGFDSLWQYRYWRSPT